MNFSLVLACIVAVVVSIEANGRSYTDNLLGSHRGELRGINRQILSECRSDFDCRSDESCVFRRNLGVGQCVSVLGVSGNVYDQTGVFGTLGGVRGGQIYDRGFQGIGIGLPGQRCQVFDSQTCLTGVSDFRPIRKFTFDHTRGYCVLVNVCDKCIGWEGPAYNLFSDERVCNRVCGGNNFRSFRSNSY